MADNNNLIEAEIKPLKIQGISSFVIEISDMHLKKLYEESFKKIEGDAYRALIYLDSDKLPIDLGIMLGITYYNMNKSDQPEIWFGLWVELESKLFHEFKVKKTNLMMEVVYNDGSVGTYAANFHQSNSSKTDYGFERLIKNDMIDNVKSIKVCIFTANL